MTRQVRRNVLTLLRRLVPEGSTLQRALQATAYGAGRNADVPALDLALLKRHPHGIDLGALQPMLTNASTPATV
ncbi:MAG: hypothetical protein R3F38_17315 [Gammaproteobacteria bacterium]